MTSINAISAATSLSTRIRESTSRAHREAESAPLVGDLVAGVLPVVDYARFVAQHHAIYRTLEEAVEVNAEPDLAPFHDPALTRLPSLEDDLTFLAGPTWATKLPILPATQEYCDRIATAAATPAGLLAHHYIRYLGDLSGGQLIRKAVERAYGLTDGVGTAFYRFEQIERPGAFKSAYRRNLDALPWAEKERTTLIEEVDLAYRHHSSIFRALSD